MPTVSGLIIRSDPTNKQCCATFACVRFQRKEARGQHLLSIKEQPGNPARTCSLPRPARAKRQTPPTMAARDIKSQRHVALARRHRGNVSDGEGCEGDGTLSLTPGVSTDLKSFPRSSQRDVIGVVAQQARWQM